MNTDNDFYNNSDYKYTEIGIALTDFIYGDKVQIAVPNITPFMDNNSIVNITENLSDCNIINADKDSLGLGNMRIEKCSGTNNMIVNVPWYLADKITPMSVAYSDSAGDLNPSVEFTNFIKINPKGTKGTQFIVTFVGGDLSKPRIIGRM